MYQNFNELNLMISGAPHAQIEVINDKKVEINVKMGTSSRLCLQYSVRKNKSDTPMRTNQMDQLNL